ncbi:hypothetical protein T310_4426 [Rasamsonia emersonii CBS 393.64]|uniref:AA1-like domain-containing protein n=1 Tax=Rasamsonia emersonii (strain ATCC 16479 / CBS 393.64 / IMI 116815) TaxID=1408163 RepID=A0A0F4YTV9_RASE3|nr:hypothetical protein T310_4426 [Rasamsonia emersonii CBS 393.64]KKA21555.1 hypothetical protein T310_4426 [Rasamsonia emersonii CBS 393.64]
MLGLKSSLPAVAYLLLLLPSSSIASVLPIRSPDSTSTIHPLSRSSGTAECNYYLIPGKYLFNVTDIQGWATDDPLSQLYKFENSCGYLTEWDWNVNDGSVAWASFAFPLQINVECVEGAVAAAGGPKITCMGPLVGPQPPSVV